MIVLLENDAGPAQVGSVRRILAEAGYGSTHWREPEGELVGAVGHASAPPDEALIGCLRRLPFVARVASCARPWPLASREWRGAPSVVPIADGLAVGGEALVVIAGPCSVEGRERLLRASRAVRDRGADALRGGAFKPRTSPHAFQGRGEAGLALLREASALTGLPVVTEVMEARDLDAVEAAADVLQIGSRNMDNYALLKAVGRSRKPVLLKRGMCATVDEWLHAAEYVLCGGNPRVVLCERGIRTFETATRNTLDLNAIPLVKRLTHLPVIVDPSHGTGRRELVTPMALAAIAAGADGLMLEVHPAPEEAVSDGGQSLTPAEFADLMARAAVVARAVGRRLPGAEAAREETTP